MTNSDKIPKYPIGIQNFPKLREEGYLYIDKTALIHRLVSTGGYYFLSRPRRFGKSLLLSTIEAYFQGRRELFADLAIDSLTTEWDAHPVLHLALNGRQYADTDSLIKELNRHLEIWEATYGDEKADRDVEERFGYIIRRAYERTGRKVVILVDEYDTPLLHAYNNPGLASNYRAILKAFYGNLKTCDQYIKFAMLTGVARFSKVSIFSDLNNLNDISFEDAYSAICGITDTELREQFRPGLQQLADSLNLDLDGVLHQLRCRYDGYRFSARGTDIYNPFSLMNVFRSHRLTDYWFETGTPTFVVNMLRRGQWRLPDLEGYRIRPTTLAMAGVEGDDPIPVLYQSGYLTIKSYDSQFNKYILGYPNSEVRQSFLEYLLPYYIAEAESRTEFDIEQFCRYVINGDIKGFMNLFGAMIAKVPYADKGASPESRFQDICYLLFTLMGYFVTAEERISDGRTDIRVITDRFIYIFEFKIDRPAQEALDQILSKRYWEPYTSSGKEIRLIGASFDSTRRRLTDWIESPLPL